MINFHGGYMAKIIARIKFRKWAVILKPIWIIQIAFGAKDVWVPKCAFKVDVK